MHGDGKLKKIGGKLIKKSSLNTEKVYAIEVSINAKYTDIEQALN